MLHASIKQAFGGSRVGICVVTCLSLGACGGGGSSGGGNQAPPPSDPTPAPNLQISASGIDFGQVLLDQRVQRQLVVTNTGNVDLDVVPGVDNFLAFGVNGDCDNLAPGNSCEFLVSFNPQTQEVFSADLELDSSADVPPIPLTGEGVALRVEITELATDCSTDSVTGRVIVSDSLNFPVVGLDSSNFTLYLGGDPSNGIDPFTVDAISLDAPVSVGLVIDISQSLAGFRNDIAQQASFFLEDNFDDDDTAGVFRFAAEPDPNDLARGFVATDAAGIDSLTGTFSQPFDGSLDNTVIYDSVDTVLDLVIEENNPKRAIVVLSDGQDTVSSISLEELIAKAADENIAVFTIGFGELDSEPLERLANETGGLFFPAPDSTELGTTFDSIASNVTNQYDISFVHPAPQSEAVLTVEVLRDPDRGEDSRDVPSCP